jgi:hypothetical protein
LALGRASAQSAGNQFPEEEQVSHEFWDCTARRRWLDRTLS